MIDAIAPYPHESSVPRRDARRGLGAHRQYHLRRLAPSARAAQQRLRHRQGGAQPAHPPPRGRDRGHRRHRQRHPPRRRQDRHVGGHPRPRRGDGTRSRAIPPMGRLGRGDRRRSAAQGGRPRAPPHVRRGRRRQRPILLGRGPAPGARSRRGASQERRSHGGSDGPPAARPDSRGSHRARVRRCVDRGAVRARHGGRRRRGPGGRLGRRGALLRHCSVVRPRPVRAAHRSRAARPSTWRVRPLHEGRTMSPAGHS